MRRFAFVLVLLSAAYLTPVSARADDLDRRVAEQMHTNAARYGIAGQAVLVRHNGQRLVHAVAGDADIATHRPVTAQTVFNVYSLAKLLTSTLVMQRVESGDIVLDAPASRYLPGLPARWQAITVRQFLDHASGVPEYFQSRDGVVSTAQGPGLPPTLPAVWAMLDGQPLQFAPGSANRYTQTNYLVLTALLEAQYQQPYARIVERRILRQLGLRQTWLGPPPSARRDRALGYIGRAGALHREDDVAWPSYAHGHAALHTTLGDLDRFMLAMSRGELVSRSTLHRLWQPQALADGRSGGFASGWEYEESGAYREVGHDGGTRVRVRLAFKDGLDGDRYSFVYLTNGSAKNVWSRTLVDSTMAVVAPRAFPRQALSERLITHALEAGGDRDSAALQHWLRNDSGIAATDLEREINRAGYAIRENLGNAAGLEVFQLNTELFPRSANTWDSLAETCAAMGDQRNAARYLARARQLASPVAD